MADLCRVLMVGNLSRAIERQVRPDGGISGVSTLCAGRMALVAGQPITETLRITVEILGAARVAAVAQQFGVGSRVLVEGHLAWRDSIRLERLACADGSGDALVRVPRNELVLVIDTIFNADPPLPADEARRQPQRMAWE